MNTYPRESVEFQPVTVMLDGVSVTAGVKFAVMPLGERPPAAASFADPTILSGKIGVMVDGYTPGAYTVWARVVAAPETVIVDCGYFNVD